MAIETQFAMTFVAGFGIGFSLALILRYMFDHA